jgi:hypothetical protein
VLVVPPVSPSLVHVLTEHERATVERSPGVALSRLADTAASIISSDPMNGGGLELYPKPIIVKDVDPTWRRRPMSVLGVATDEEH